MSLIRLKDIRLVESRAELANIPPGKILINTINAHSYNVARKDAFFVEALSEGDYLIPDGMSIVKACRWLHARSQPKERIAGADLFEFEMSRLNQECSKEGQNTNTAKNNGDTEGQKSGIVMFMGSSEKTLAKIVEKAAKVYPNLKVVTYSPPYKPEFSDEDSKAIVNAINSANPDLLWIGMTAPKQEKWTYSHWNELNIHCHVGTIGAVFDFFAGNTKRAPLWWQQHSLEWLYRLTKEPRRMWRRYIIGNTVFLWHMIGEKIHS